jgi:hypothetical protein
MTSTKLGDLRDGSKTFGDSRRLSSFKALLEGMQREQSTVLNRISKTEGERKRYERFINSSQVDVEEVIANCCIHKPCEFEGQSVLNIIDESKIRFGSAVGRIEGNISSVGKIGNGWQYGQNCVSGLVVNSGDGRIRGLSSLQFWSQEPEQLGYRNWMKLFGRDARPIHLRSSYKWVVAIEQAAYRLQSARSVTHVMDREADDIKVLIGLSKCNYANKQHFVLRCKDDRWVTAHKGKENGVDAKALRMSQLLAKQSQCFTYEVRLQADRRIYFKGIPPAQGSKKNRIHYKQKRRARRSVLAVHYVPFSYTQEQIKGSLKDLPGEQKKQLIAQSDLAGQTLYLVQVKEIAAYDLKTARQLDEKEYEPIKWTLCTDRPVDCAEQAMEVVGIYTKRWLIEQVFRLLKHQGLRIEQAQYKSLKALQIILAMALNTSTLAMQLVQARDKEEGFPIEDYFNPTQIKVLEKCHLQYEGKTKVQQNPFPPDQLSWAAWIIARMGGWKPENKKRPPGPISMSRGLEKFDTFLLAFEILGTDDNPSQP